MSELPISSLFAILILLIFLSAFFSSSETSMMSLNRYKLKHQVKKKHRGAMRAAKLLQRPDRLISMILIGNNFINILASAIATIIALRLFGDAGVAAATALLTLVILIFAEVTPKTVAAIKPERVAYPASLILKPLQFFLYPFVWILNIICNRLLRILGFDVEAQTHDYLSSDELRTLVNESGAKIPHRHQSMLVSILDLESVIVEDVMIPRNEIIGIDVNDGIESIISTLSQTKHTRLPVYKDELNNIIGIIHVRHVLPLLQMKAPSEQDFLDRVKDAYFIPMSTPLNTQLFNFQKARHWMALVVDEYGDVQGMTTLEDLLEEIVGDITEHHDSDDEDIYPQEDGSYFIDGTATIRDINKALRWDLPTNGPKTINGLITEQLEEIPKNNVCLKMHDYLIETVQISDNFIKTARLQKLDKSDVEEDDY